MLYPPPPYLIVTAYIHGNVSWKEAEYLLDLWHKKHEPPKEEDDEQQHDN